MGQDSLSNHVSEICQAGYRGRMVSCLVVLWAPGFKHSGQNNEEGSWHFVASGSSNWTASNPLPGYLPRMAQEAVNPVSDCRATEPLNWKWFSPARRTPTDCHFKVTTSAPLLGSDKLASNLSFGWGLLMTLFRLLVMLYIPFVKVNNYS